MDKRIVGLLGAAAALTTVTSVQAAPAQNTELVPATSYRDLLDPIPNAVPMLKADNERRAEARDIELAQVTVQVGHPHHHHHRVIVVKRRHHHHHHHHHDHF